MAERGREKFQLLSASVPPATARMNSCPSSATVDTIPKSSDRRETHSARFASLSEVESGFASLSHGNAPDARRGIHFISGPPVIVHAGFPGKGAGMGQCGDPG